VVEDALLSASGGKLKIPAASPRICYLAKDASALQRLASQSGAAWENPFIREWNRKFSENVVYSLNCTATTTSHLMSNPIRNSCASSDPCRKSIAPEI
jgi:hypothetical protein